jgi:hypothetical protein
VRECDDGTEISQKSSLWKVFLVTHSFEWYKKFKAGTEEVNKRREWGHMCLKKHMQKWFSNLEC